MFEDDTVDFEVEDPLLGKLLQNKYGVVRRIGSGGMGTVYEGKHRIIGKRVAIKFLHAQFAADPNIVKRFRREAQATVSIGHPNIVEVMDMGSQDGFLYMILEYLEGSALGDYMKETGPLPLDQAVHILSQVCDALTAAHKAGYVHRDLKPDNVFLIERGDDTRFVKLLDFGIAKLIEAGGGMTKLTQTGASIGTPYYMAPEQINGAKDIDGRADIFALGAMAYQMLAGVLPFEDASYPALLVKVCHTAPTPLGQLRQDLPKNAVAVIDRMLSKDRDARFENAAAVKAALAPFADVSVAPIMGTAAPLEAPRLMNTAQAASTPINASQPPTLPTSRAPMMLSAGLALVGVLGLGGAYAAGAFDGTPAEDPSLETVPDDPAASATSAAAAPTDVEDGRATVAVSVAPASATLRLDGAPISNPFTGELEVRDTPYHLEVSAEGYATESRDFVLGEDGAQWAISLAAATGEATESDDERDDDASGSRRHHRRSMRGDTTSASSSAATMELPTAMTTGTTSTTTTTTMTVAVTPPPPVMTDPPPPPAMTTTSDPDPPTMTGRDHALKMVQF